MTYRTPTTLLPQAAPKKDSRLACRVDDELKLRLGAVAKRHGRKESELMRHALEQLVTQLEAEDAAECAAANLAREFPTRT